ncbi:SAM-dependent methyltransferase [Actinomycetospora atypica]|uniref:SAM-dependent methyltransferase n=1 Tax=Actinomycetospora atypica TaxID=1290095 RepID=A0ABV9YPX7_9PSEU
MPVEHYPAPPPPGPPAPGTVLPYDLGLTLDRIASTAADLELPNYARTIDCLLGGSANFAVDRWAAADILQLDPLAECRARANRAFVRRVIRWAHQRGIDQFLDLGCGIPSIQSVHGIVHAVNPDARVAYVDLDPVAVAHARELVADMPRVTVTWGDLRAPACVLSAPDVAAVLDLSRPVAVLACGVLHFVHDDIAALLRDWRSRLPAGSVLAVSHGARVRRPTVDLLDSTYSRSVAGIAVRTEEEIAGLFSVIDPVAPGVVDVVDWPHPGTGGRRAVGYPAAVGFV